MRREAMEKALKVLLRYRNETPLGHQPSMITDEADEAIQSLRVTLSAPEQQPVAWEVSFYEDKTNGDRKHVVMTLPEPASPAIIDDPDVASRTLIRARPLVYADAAPTAQPADKQQEVWSGWRRFANR